MGDYIPIIFLEYNRIEKYFIHPPVGEIQKNGWMSLLFVA